VQGLLERLGTTVSRHRKGVLVAWVAVLVAGGYFALHQQDNLQGGGWEVPGTQAQRANELIRGFNGYSIAGLAIVVTAPTQGSAKATIDGNRYRATICCAPASSPVAAFGSDPALIAAKIERDARDPSSIARDIATTQPLPTVSPFATGKALSNLCADVIQLQTPAEIRAAAASVPKEWRPLVLSPETTPPLTLAACRVWGVPPAPRSQRAPVTSSIPAIVLVDEWDHVIYAGEGRGIAKNLRNARLYELPGLDHIALLNFLGRDVSCPQGIVTAFVARPTAFPVGGCTKSMPEPRLAPPG